MWRRVHEPRIAWGVAFVVASGWTSGTVSPAVAADQQATAPVRTVVIGEQYKAGGLPRALWGADYRDLYTTPVELPVLDLATYAGGLTPTGPLGHGETQALGL